MYRRYLLPIAVATAISIATFGAGAAEDKPSMMDHPHAMEHQEVTIVHLVESAKTAADHEAVAKKMEEEAAELDKKAEHHQKLAKHYKMRLGVGPKSSAASLATHCENLARNYRASAQELRDMAQLHRDVARSLGR